MDKNSAIGLGLMLALLVGYFIFTQPSEAQLKQQQQFRDSITQVEALKKLSADTMSPISAGTEVKMDTIVDLGTTMGKFGKNDGAEEKTTLSNQEFTIDFTNKGGRVAQVKLNKYKRADSTDLILFNADQSNWGYEFVADGRIIKTSDLTWSIFQKTDNSITYRLYYDNSSFISQRYQLTKDSYLVNYQLNLVNMNGKVSSSRSILALNWGIDIPRQEKDVKPEREKSTIYYRLFKDDPSSISETKYTAETLEGKAEWISFKQQFFNSTLIATKNPFAAQGIIETIESKSDDVVKKFKASLDIDFQQLSNEKYDLSFYFGPNHVPTLKKVGVELDQIVPLGWVLFRAVNEYAIIPLFNFLRTFFSNYGLVIFLLTLIVKLILLPLTYKSYKSTAKMKVLKPEIDAIKEKHKNDMQKSQAETMSLYKSFGVSPMGGCLPMVLQMPILLSIFFFFPSSIELRQESFLWAEDLSRYDSILSLGFEIPFYGDHVSLFTILMTLATLLYTYMNNEISGATGPMKSVGYIMPVFFLGFFNNYASGLTYYYFLSNMITFTQQWAIRKFFVDEKKVREQMETFKKSKKGQKAKIPSKFQQRLEEMAKKRGIDTKTGKRK